MELFPLFIFFVSKVGECGSTLSGGQKQRLSLARAAYSRHELVLLDDPLSAVDVHLTRHIFQECVLGLLMGRAEGSQDRVARRTVVFVSHLVEVREASQCAVFRRDVTYY